MKRWWPLDGPWSVWGDQSLPCCGHTQLRSNHLNLESPRRSGKIRSGGGTLSVSVWGYCSPSTGTASKHYQDTLSMNTSSIRFESMTHRISRHCSVPSEQSNEQSLGRELAESSRTSRIDLEPLWGHHHKKKTKRVHHTNFTTKS